MAPPQAVRYPHVWQPTLIPCCALLRASQPISATSCQDLHKPLLCMLCPMSAGVVCIAMGHTYHSLPAPTRLLCQMKQPGTTPGWRSKQTHTPSLVSSNTTMLYRCSSLSAGVMCAAMGLASHGLPAPVATLTVRPPFLYGVQRPDTEARSSTKQISTNMCRATPLCASLFVLFAFAHLQASCAL